MANEADINDLSLQGEVIEVDDNVTPEEFFNPPLADDGDYEVGWKLGSRGITIKRQWQDGDKEKPAGVGPTGKPFVSAHLQFVETNGSGPGKTIAFDDVSTVVFDSSAGKTSRAHMAFAAAGHKIPSGLSVPDVRDFMEKAMAQNPRSGITTQWQAQAEDPKATKKKEKYVTLLKGQARFPKILDADGNETGRHDPEVTDPKTGLTGKAQVKVTKYASL